MTDDEKEKIRKEEIFRQEVRTQIESTPPPTRSARAWKFLNSPFGLWVLSSIVVSGLGLLYAGWSSHQAKVEANHTVERRLDVEIARRLLKFEKDLKATVKNNYQYDWYATSLHNLKSSDNPVFSEFKLRSLSSLLLELELVVSTAQQQSINTATEAILSYEEQISLLDRGMPVDEIKHRVNLILEEIASKFALDRWRRQGNFTKTSSTAPVSVPPPAAPPAPASPPPHPV